MSATADAAEGERQLAGKLGSLVGQLTRGIHEVDVVLTGEVGDHGGKATAMAALAGIYALTRIPLDAIPDLSDTQVIIYTEYPGQAPQVVRDLRNGGRLGAQNRGAEDVDFQQAHFDGSAVPPAPCSAPG